MEVTIHAKNTTITPSIESAAKAMLKKALHINECEFIKVVVEKTNEKEKNKAYKLTSIINTKMDEIVVSKHGADVYKTFTVLSGDLARHVRKAKERHSRKQRQTKAH